MDKIIGHIQSTSTIKSNINKKTNVLKSTINYPGAGDSAYQVAVNNGFIGTEEEWLASLKGDRGETGKQGEKGDNPIRGTDYWTEEDKEEVKGFVDNSVADLETVLQNILTAIQEGGTTSNTISEIEQLIVSYFENKTVGEVEE